MVSCICNRNVAFYTFYTFLDLKKVMIHSDMASTRHRKATTVYETETRGGDFFPHLDAKKSSSAES